MVRQGGKPWQKGIRGPAPGNIVPQSHPAGQQQLGGRETGRQGDREGGGYSGYSGYSRKDLEPPPTVPTVPTVSTAPVQQQRTGAATGLALSKGLDTRAWLGTEETQQPITRALHKPIHACQVIGSGAQAHGCIVHCHPIVTHSWTGEEPSW